MELSGYFKAQQIAFNTIEKVSQSPPPQILKELKFNPLQIIMA